LTYSPASPLVAAGLRGLHENKRMDDYDYGKRTFSDAVWGLVGAVVVSLGFWTIFGIAIWALLSYVGII